MESPENPTNIVPFENTESNEQRAEKLGADLYYKMQKVLDDYQSAEQNSNPASIQSPELVSFPGMVEGALADCWEAFKKKNNLGTDVYLQAGAGEYGNSCGLFNNETGKNYPIYDNVGNYGGLVNDRISDRLVYGNMKTAIQEILEGSLAAAA